MGLHDCFQSYIGKWIAPPRNKVFKIEAQSYLLTKMVDEEQYLEIKFESGTPLRLHYWRFNLVIDILTEAKGEYVIIGSRINPQETHTIEGSLVCEAHEKGYPYANLGTAPFVCDLIVLCGYAIYGYMNNPETGRRVQGVKITYENECKLETVIHFQ